MKDVYKSIHFVQIILTTNINCIHFVVTHELGSGVRKQRKKHSGGANNMLWETVIWVLWNDVHV